MPFDTDATKRIRKTDPSPSIYLELEEAEEVTNQSAVIATAEACPIVLKLIAIAVLGRPVNGFSWMTLTGHAGSGVS